MSRKLFCEISPLTYRISEQKEILLRHIRNIFSRAKISYEKGERLPHTVYAHNSLIRRKLGNTDMRLQENKAANLAIAAPHVSGILIKPGETFSLWALVGKTTKSRGYAEGLTLTAGKTSSGFGGGLCQFSNLLHFMALHSPLEITEHHHHDGFDLFPDYGRQVPFGCGTSIMYNYLDYRLKNNTEITFQFIVYLTPTHLCGELLADKPLDKCWHILEADKRFEKGEDGKYYRCNSLYRQEIDKYSGKELSKTLFKESHALVMYDESYIPAELIK